MLWFHSVRRVVRLDCQVQIASILDPRAEENLPRLGEAVLAFVHRQNGPSGRVNQLRANPVHAGKIFVHPYSIRKITSGQESLRGHAFSSLLSLHPCECVVEQFRIGLWVNVEFESPQGCDDVASIYESIVGEPAGVSLRGQHVFCEDRELKQIAACPRQKWKVVLVVTRPELLIIGQSRIHQLENNLKEPTVFFVDWLEAVSKFSQFREGGFTQP